MALQAACQLWICADMINKCCITLVVYLLLYSVVSLTPPTVVDAVIVVSCARYGSLEEIRVLQNSCC